MRLLPSLLSAAVAALTITSGWAMNNAGLIKLKKANISDETILMSVNKEPADYDTSPDGLVALKEAGISDAIIQRVLARASANSSGTGAAAASASESATSSSGTSSTPTPGMPDLFSVESPSIAPAFVDPVIGHDYFTRFSFHQEDNKYVTTNYARGVLVPINTPVKLVSMSGDKMTLRRGDTGEEIKVENVKKFSGKTISEFARVMLADEKTAVDKLNPVLTSSILSGEMRKGMTREQVLLARGYPPAHETPSLDGDRWVFWSSRFIKQTIVFANGRLVEGRGIL